MNAMTATTERQTRIVFTSALPNKAPIAERFANSRRRETGRELAWAPKTQTFALRGGK